MSASYHLDLTKLTSSQAIYEALLNDRQLVSNPKAPKLAKLISSLKLSQESLESSSKLLHSHLENGSDILIYGDYDVDGVTATSILYLSLSQLVAGTKARLLPFIPNRSRHGYGISSTSLSEIYSQQAFKETAYQDFSPSLVITVDTGIVANQEISDLREHGLDVILTDHHKPADSLPSSNNLIHSTLSSGAVIAWVVALYYLEESDYAYSLIDLATLGVIADLIPLTGINRALVKHGLVHLSNSQRPGILALKELAKIANQPLSVSDVSFKLAPRLNAAGRLADAITSLRLLCTSSHTQANQLALELDRYNKQRQDLTSSGVNHALSLNSSDSLLIISSQEYHEGVVGLIAGKLVERFHKPALAISLSDDLAKGSARSIKGVDITALLRHFESDFIGLGGHQLAAGFSFDPANLDDLKKSLVNYANDTIDPQLLTHSITADGLLNLSQTSESLVKLLSQLAPFGIGNPRPRFLSNNLNILEDKPLGSSGQHRRFTLEQAGHTRQVIYFNCPLPHHLSSLSSLVYTLDLNQWNNRTYLQLVAKHAIL